jgi:hypothetical protein
VIPEASREGVECLDFPREHYELSRARSHPNTAVPAKPRELCFAHPGEHFLSPPSSPIQTLRFQVLGAREIVIKSRRRPQRL